MRYRVKVFSSSDGFMALEESINNWMMLSSEDFDLVDVKFQDNPSYCSALVIYTGPNLPTLPEGQIDERVDRSLNSAGKEL